MLLDWPGLGDVPSDPGVNGLDDLVSRVLERLDGPADLVAQSMGGVVAIRAALERPGMIRRLVLTATSGGIDTSPFRAQDWRPKYRREFPQAASWILEHRSDLGDRLGAITAPTLLVWGDADPVSPVGIGEYLLQRLRHARLVVIKGGDHALARDQAGKVAAHIAAHLGPDPAR